MIPAAVRRAFDGYPFGDPCTSDDLDRAEAALGGPIPRALRELYLSFDGFGGPTGAAFFWPLFGRDSRGGGGTSLVKMNLFLRDGDPFPEALTRQCWFYGDDGTGPAWGLKADLPGKVIWWDAEWGDDFEIVGDNILQAWLDAKRRYDDLGNEMRGPR